MRGCIGEGRDTREEAIKYKPCSDIKSIGKQTAERKKESDRKVVELQLNAKTFLYYSFMI
jgi:hypothetical protein